MSKQERQSGLSFLDKSWVAAESSMNASCIDRDGKSHNLMGAAIDTKNITTLDEYMRYADPKLKNITEPMKDNEKLMRTYVIPVTLENGQNIDVIVNQKGQDMACVFLDIEGKENQFAVTPRMQKEILSKGLKNIEGVISTEIAKEGLIPKTLEEFEEAVEKDTLVPKNAKESVEKIKEKAPSADIKAVEGEEEEKDTKQNEEETEIPEGAKDDVSKFRENYKGGKLKQVLEVDDPESINDKLDGNTGITKEGGKVYCLRFADSGASLSDKVVMIQGEKVVENSKYDNDMTELMNDKTQNGVKDLEDNDSKIYITDSDGKTTEYDLIAKPKDLSIEEKKDVNIDMTKIEEELEKEREKAEKIQSEIEQISNTLEQYEDNPDPEIIENVIEPAGTKLEEKKGELESVYDKIGELNKERVEILTSKGLDHLVPIPEEKEETHYPVRGEMPEERGPKNF